MSARNETKRSKKTRPKKLTGNSAKELDKKNRLKTRLIEKIGKKFSANTLGKKFDKENTRQKKLGEKCRHKGRKN